MKLILVRHAETEWNRLGRCQGFADLELNENGRGQVKELAKSLRDKVISAVYSSDLRRAVDTAKAIADCHGLTVEIDPDLREMNQGDLEGLTFDVIREKYAELLTEWRENPELVRLPLGETLKEVQERALKSVEKMYSKHSGETVVAVSHNLTIVTLLCKFTGVELKEFLSFKLQASSKNVILFENSSCKVDFINDVSHLGQHL
ncbi:MAG TPA: histidine phosphatase family protein [Thermodesulfobacteriota bacterium]|nr:histidine phosphatase family protein [Thermodesulfobacteriota bacterium]